MSTIVLPTTEKQRGRRASSACTCHPTNNRGTMSNVARSSNLITRTASDRRDRSNDHNLGCSLSALFLYFFSIEPSVDLSAFSWAAMQQGESI